VTVTGESVGESVRYDSSPWSRKAGASREWVLDVSELTTPVSGHVGRGQVLPDQLLSIAGLGLSLTDAQRAALAREELASITEWEIRFEALLEAGFAGAIATARDVTSPRLTFMLHEMGEETGHQRVFQRLLAQLEPRTRWPVPHRLRSAVYRRAAASLMRRPALLFVLVLAGEEVTDVFQELAAEHPATDPFVRAVYEYHREEEADHVSFAQAVYAESWVDSTWVDRALVRWAAPAIIAFLVDSMVHPGVYAVAGLPTLETWRAVRAGEQRSAFRQHAVRPVLSALLEAGALTPGRVPRPWRDLCDVDRHGRELPQ
jgi:P-aminobenzoate N-oxygenase AurF